jgi:DNA mismatch endonuclease, patch repair protein
MIVVRSIRDWYPKRSATLADNLSPEQRRRTMQAVKGKDTSLERKMALLLQRVGRRPQRNVAHLPGKPDLAFGRFKVAVFVDGNFWHGWRFNEWRDKLGDYWKAKIERNRARDRKTFQRLRRMGWIVVRIWEHQLKRDPDGCVERVEAAIRKQIMGSPVPFRRSAPVASGTTISGSGGTLAGRSIATGKRRRLPREERGTPKRR